MTETNQAPTKPRTDRSAAAAEERWQKMRFMAESGRSTEEIASAVGLGIERVATLLHRRGVRQSRLAPEAIRARHEKIRAMTLAHHTLNEIAREVGMHPDSVRIIIKNAGLELTGRAGERRSRFNHNTMLEQILEDAEAMCTHLNLVNINEVDQARVAEWSTRAGDISRTFKAFTVKLKGKQL